MLQSEEFLDKEVRKNINELFNILYIDCKDDYGKIDKETLEELSIYLKEKVSTHIDCVIDTYSKL